MNQRHPLLPSTHELVSCKVDLRQPGKELTSHRRCPTASRPWTSCWVVRALVQRNRRTDGNATRRQQTGRTLPAAVHRLYTGNDSCNIHILCITLVIRIKEAIHIRKEGQQAMNRDESSYQLSHAYDRFLDTASSRCVKNRKNWVPASYNTIQYNIKTYKAPYVTKKVIRRRWGDTWLGNIGNANKMTFKFTLKTLTELQSLMSYGRSFQLVAAECL